MNKIIIGIIILLVIIGGYFVYHAKIQKNNKQLLIKNNSNNSIKEISVEDAVLKNDCDNLKNEIENSFKKINYCNIDSDCIVENNHVCPFGCYILYNKKEDILKINQKIDDYLSNGCGSCKYKCQQVKQKEVKCIKNKCVDIKFYKNDIKNNNN